MASTPIPDMPYMHLVESTGEVKFSSPEVDYPLYIKALENLTVKFNNTYEYSKDNVTWTSATSSTSISANAGEKVFFRASGLTASSSSGIGQIYTSSGRYNVGGNIMSMIYGADFKGKTEITQAYQFYSLFSYGVVDASGLALPATTLTESCYRKMFYNCSSLVNAPALPATTLAKYCYQEMFYQCSSLVTAPTLPATTLAYYCYAYMFQGCRKLVNAPVLAATTLANYCCYFMFKDCSSLVNAPALHATTLWYYCYAYMFQGCTSLVNAPALPATTLAQYCYSFMFSNCTSLVNAPALPATTLTVNCYGYMFQNCTSLVTAPTLPATTLVSFCYSYMFQNCTSLSYIKAMFKKTSSALNNWVSGVASTGTFVKNSAATWADTFGPSAIPEGWTVETADA